MPNSEPSLEPGVLFPGVFIGFALDNLFLDVKSITDLGSSHCFVSLLRGTLSLVDVCETGAIFVNTMFPDLLDTVLAGLFSTVFPEIVAGVLAGLLNTVFRELFARLFAGLVNTAFNDLLNEVLPSLDLLATLLAGLVSTVFTDLLNEVLAGLENTTFPDLLATALAGLVTTVFADLLSEVLAGLENAVLPDLLDAELAGLVNTVLSGLCDTVLVVLLNTMLTGSLGSGDFGFMKMVLWDILDSVDTVNLLISTLLSHVTEVALLSESATNSARVSDVCLVRVTLVCFRAGDLRDGEVTGEVTGAKGLLNMGGAGVSLSSLSSALCKSVIRPCILCCVVSVTPMVAPLPSSCRE